VDLTRQALRIVVGLLILALLGAILFGLIRNYT
jgi:hypothetical protein